MDIKLKNISRRPLTKLIASMLTIILITAIALQWTYIKYANLNMESIIEKEYKNSKSFAYEVHKAINDTYRLLESTEDNEIKSRSYLYLIRGADKQFTNSNKYHKNFYEKYEEAFFSYENGRFSVGNRTNPMIITSFLENIDNTRKAGGQENKKIVENKDYIMYIAFTDTYMQEWQESWDTGRERLIPIIFSIIICASLVLLLLIYLILVTGRKFGTEELYLSGVDKIHTEFLILASIPIMVFFLSIHKIIYYDNNIGQKLNNKHIFTMYLIGVATIAMASLFLISLLALARKIKDKRFIEGSITYIFAKNINPRIKDIFDKNRFKDHSLTRILYKRQRIFIVISAVLVFLTFLFILMPPLMILPPILEIILIYWYVKYNNDIFDKINRGFNESVEERIKSERMKVELVTNVSHDLKTPLTSIISYIDLLSKEELSETSMDYVNILVKKSNRLKNIVSDLFDLARSASGDIILEIQTLDLKKLIQQTLGDMVDSIEESGLKIKTVFPKKPVYIVADGARLYRVFQNIIDNALKYSLEGTRVFIELSEDDENVFVAIKNVADYELNFTSQEVLQRFNRGDKSRTTEGSGLGLSIAESFTNVCGGDFKVDIDGDMFKVIISFKIVQSVEV